MRRSAAPSQSNKIKRFCTPFKNRTLEENVPDNLETVPSCPSKRSAEYILNLLSKPRSPENQKPDNKHNVNALKDTEDPIDFMFNSEFDIEYDPVTTDRTPEPVSETDQQSLSKGSSAKYFSVVWCKLSAKKHKKWEGDAVLIIQGRTAILKDTDGKEIGKAFGYKLKEVEALEEESHFKIGGKECEIQGIISEEDYLSGKCFGNGTQPDLEAQKSNLPLKPFANPISKSGHDASMNAVRPPSRAVRQLVRLTPDSFVMPPPSSMHQWKNNQEKLPVTNVIVEPFLASLLRTHQREGIIFLYQCIMGMKEFVGSGAILADEMGLGKTLQCITLIWTLFKQGPYGRKPVLKKILIITPSSLVKNWKQEFKKWLGSNRMNIFYVDQQNKLEDFLKNPSYPVLVLSYEMYVRSYEALSVVKFDLLICDEAHRLKSTNIKTTTCLKNVSTKRRILLTGTPVQNDLQEFFSLVEFCNPGILGTPASFRNVYEEPILRSQLPSASIEEKALGETRAAELNRLTSLFVLRRTQNVINRYLPGKVEFVVFCKPTTLQAKMYKHFIDTVRSCLSSSLADTASHLACIQTLRKICNHPSLLSREDHENETEEEVELTEPVKFTEKQIVPDNFEEVPLEESSGKLKVTANLLASLNSTLPREKIVLVSFFTKTLDILQQLCECTRYSFLRLDGSTPTASRMKLVDQFNDPSSDCFVFLLSSKAGGVGLNLIGASRILLYDIDWNPANDLQSMARIWRDGQKRDVYIYRLLTTGTIEEKMYQRQIKKQDLSGTVVDSKDSAKVKFSLQELKDLFSFNEISCSTTHDLLECSCLDGVEQYKPTNTPSIQRNCQLVNTTQASLKKAVTMSDLIYWDHIPSLVTEESLQDKHLAAASEDISFVFRNVIKKASFPDL